MTSTLDTTAGYIIMRNVVGSFAIDIVTVWGGTSSQQTPSITATISELTALNCEGFSPPFDQPLSIKKKTKRTIPVDIRLLDGSGDVVTDADITAPPVINVSYQGFGVGDVAPASLELLPVGSANEGNFFRFDPGSEQ